MKKEKLLEIINTIKKNRNEVLINSIDETSDLRNDLGMESLDLAELTVRIEAEYDIDIFEDGIVNTIGEILNKLENKR
ncbi:MAG: acyl carrier protein [Prolixibacteraceae bacterium]|nr:acyl carrier protein [Prolixibacteraceae bacterium]